MADQANGKAELSLEARLEPGLDSGLEAGPDSGLEAGLDSGLEPGLFERALDATGDGVLLRGPDGMLLWANQEATRQLGLSVNELRALPPDRIAERYEVFDTEGHPFAPQAFPGRRALTEPGVRGEREIVLRSHDRRTGEERWAGVRARELRSLGGKVLGSVTVFRDLTENQQARIARDLSEQRLGLLASAGPRLLATSLDGGGILELLADLVVPTLADYCSVREVDADGSVRRVAVRHADPAKAALVRRLEAFPPWSERLVSAAMLAGRPYLAAELDPKLLDDVAVSPEHRGILSELDPRSLVAVPVMANGRTVGTLVAISAESGRRYGPGDGVFFEDLARRAGLAIENALLFEKEHEARAQAERTRSEIGFLLEASTLLASSSLDFGEALQRLSQLTASTLCDLCLIDLLDPIDGSIVRVAATAADPADQPLADRLKEHFAPLPASDHPAARVMRSGAAEFAYDMSAEFLRETTRSDEHRQLISELSFRSYITVPLAARGRVLGALTLVATTASGRRYGDGDLALAADLARRAALALDNARLFQEIELQKALLGSQSEATIEGALVVSPRGRIVSYNRQLADMWSVPEGLLESGDGDRLLDWVTSQVVDAEAFRTQALQLRAERHASARDQIVLTDGRVFDRWSSPLVGGDGMNYGRAFYFRDVTDLKQAQEERVRLYDAERDARLEAETSRARLQFLLEASTVLAVSLDTDTALGALADLVVRTLADACLIDLVGDDGPSLRIGRGRDADSMSVEGHPLAPGGAPARVMASRVPLLAPGPGGGHTSSGASPWAFPGASPGETKASHGVPPGAFPGASPGETKASHGVPPGAAPGAFPGDSQASHGASPGAAPGAFPGDSQASHGASPGAALGAFPGVASYLGVPLAARGRVLGCLSLVSGERRYGTDDLALAQDLARRVGLALDHVRLFDAHRHIAMTLQESLLPPELPAVPGIDLAARYRPALETTEVGGDFYDVFPAGGGAWAFVIGDISGKGVEAAALTSMARYTVRAAAREHRQPREILSLLNEAVLAEGSEGRFLTIVFARLRQQSGGLRLTAASGGHPLPLLLRRDGSVEQAARPGTLIGFVETVHLPEKVTELSPGDVVVFYTDGLTDVRGPEGTFGEERLTAVLRGCLGLSADATAARLEGEVLAFLQGEPRDDLAMLVLKVSEP